MPLVSPQSPPIQAVGLSYGVAVNGAIVGAIVAVFPGMYAPRRHLSFSSTT